MRFKTERIQKEWKQLATKNPKLAFLISCLNGKTELDYGISVLVTHIYRTKEEHKELYAFTDPSRRPNSSPHCSWSAVDLRSVDFSDAQIKEIVDWCNAEILDNKYPKTALCHKIAGGAYHFHIQYKPKKEDNNGEL